VSKVALTIEMSRLYQYGLAPLLTPEERELVSGRVPKKLCDYAAKHGYLSLLQWSNRKEWSETTCDEAAYGGHLVVLQWLRAQHCPWDELTCYNAAYGGHLTVLQWLRAQGCPWNKAKCIDAARDHPAVLEWLRSGDCRN